MSDLVVPPACHLVHSLRCRVPQQEIEKILCSEVLWRVDLTANTKVFVSKYNKIFDLLELRGKMVTMLDV